MITSAPSSLARWMTSERWPAEVGSMTPSRSATSTMCSVWALPGTPGQMASAAATRPSASLFTSSRLYRSGRFRSDPLGDASHDQLLLPAPPVPDAGEAAEQATALPLIQPSPHSVLDPVAESCRQALEAHGAASTDG